MTRLALLLTLLVGCSAPANALDAADAADAPQITPPSTSCDAPLSRPDIVTIGDSTMSNILLYPREWGWGDALFELATDPARVHNAGSSGASSLDYATRSPWPGAEAMLGRGSYLLIQFGHNDAAVDPLRHTEPGAPPAYVGTFRERLLFFVDAARAVGAIPVLITPVGTMTFDATGKTTFLMDAYAGAVRKLAADERVLLLDLAAASRAEFERLGKAQTIATYSYDDTTHFSPGGARKIAALVVGLACSADAVLCRQFDPTIAASSSDAKP